MKVSLGFPNFRFTRGGPFDEALLGQDPYLSGKMTAAVTKGVQSKNIGMTVFLALNALF